MSDDYKILIVEDEVLIAEDLYDVLSSIGYFICDIAYDSESALDAIHQHQPDMVILDINIRGTKDGIEVAQIIQDRYDMPFIFLSSLSDKGTLERAKVTRPKGYLVKPFKDKDLMTTIEMAIYNHSVELQQKYMTYKHVNSISMQPLSNKEYQILTALVEGLNNRQIGEKHFVSINTVKTHVKRIFNKLQVNDRLSAIKKVTS